MKTYDLKNLGRNDISFYLGLESYLLENLTEDVFFLWRINKAIIIGKHQLLDSEVNVKVAKDKGCKIFRRPSGGGAIFADENSFMFSFITKSIDKEEVFKKYLSMIKDCLLSLGVQTEFSGRNDLLFKGKKFSGNSFYRTKNGSVLHGTFLYDSNLDELIACLTPDSDKYITKGIKSVKERVINLKDYLSLPYEETIDYFTKYIGLDNVLELKDEYKKVLEKEKLFLDYDYIYGNNPEYTFHNKKRFVYGKLEIYLTIKKQIIQDIKVFGDFFEKKDLSLFLSHFIGIPFKKDIFLQKLIDNSISDYIENSSNIDFINLIFEGE